MNLAKTNAPGVLDRSMPVYSSDSSDSSDDDVDVCSTDNVETTNTRYLIPAPYIRPTTEEKLVEDESQEHKSNETLILESKALTEQMSKLKAQLAFYESELSRSQKTLAEVYDPDLAKRRRATFQYGCRTCGNFPKRINCSCPKTTKRRRVKEVVH